MPFQRIKALIEYDRMKKYFYFNRPIKYLKRRIKAFTADEKYLLSRALCVRNKLMNNLKHLSSIGTPGKPTEGRWYNQKCRYHINRLLYLMPCQEYSHLIDLVPVSEDFEETRAVLEAFVKEDVTELVSFPGRSILAFSELWSELKTEMPSITWPSDISDSVGDSLAVLALYKILDIPERNIEKMSPEAGAFFRFCNRHPALKREFSSLSYVDELRTLQLGSNSEELFDLLISRFSGEEDFPFEVLKLGDHTSFSG